MADRAHDQVVTDRESRQYGGGPEASRGEFAVSEDRLCEGPGYEAPCRRNEAQKQPSHRCPKRRVAPEAFCLRGNDEGRQQVIHLFNSCHLAHVGAAE